MWFFGWGLGGVACAWKEKGRGGCCVWAASVSGERGPRGKGCRSGDFPYHTHHSPRPCSIASTCSKPSSASRRSSPSSMPVCGCVLVFWGGWGGVQTRLSLGGERRRREGAPEFTAQELCTHLWNCSTGSRCPRPPPRAPRPSTRTRSLLCLVCGGCFFWVGEVLASASEASGVRRRPLTPSSFGFGRTLHVVVHVVDGLLPRVRTGGVAGGAAGSSGLRWPEEWRGGAGLARARVAFLCRRRGRREALPLLCC